MLSEQESIEACESSASYSPSDPAAAGLISSDGVRVWFVNADGSRNLVQAPSKECQLAATRGIEVNSFPKRLEGYTLSPDDSKRACASPAYDARVVLHFPDLKNCKQTMAGVLLKVFVYNTGSALDICPMADDKWTTDSLSYKTTGAPLNSNQKAKCRAASSMGFQTGVVGWQTIDITNYVVGVQQGADNTGVLLRVAGPDGVGFFGSEYEAEYFRPRLEITYTQSNNIRWKIEGGNVGGVFKVEPTSGQLTVARTGILNYENAITGREYELVISATDSSGLSTFGRIQVSTLDLNENPAASTVEEREVNENVGVATVVGAPIASSDPDLVTLPHGKITYHVTGVLGAKMDYAIEKLMTRYKNVDDGLFSVHPTTGQISVGQPVLNREGDLNSYVVVLRIKDQGTPALDIFSRVTINVKDVNERPKMADQQRKIRENSPTDSSVGGPIIATDVDIDQELDFTMQTNSLFKIEGCSGKISVKNFKPTGEDEERAKAVATKTPRFPVYLTDFESATTRYIYTVTVTDNGRLPDNLATSATVTIDLTNAPEAPIVFPESFSMAEGTERGTFVGVPIRGSDVDKGQTKTLKFSITDGNSGKCGDSTKCPLFKINPSSGQIELDHAGAKLWSFKTQTDSGNMIFAGEPFASPLLSFSSGSVEWEGSIGLNLREDAFWGYTVAGKFTISTWEEGADAKLYGNTNLRVWVAGMDASTYLTKFATSDEGSAKDTLNFERKKTYDLAVRATDVDGLTGEAYVTISVTDINEPPVLQAQLARVAEGAAQGINIGTPVSADDDSY